MNNGNGNGGGFKRIEKLLVFHEGVAKALRTTLDVLRGHAIDSSLRRAEHTVIAAIGIERTRKRKRVEKRQTVAHTRAARERSAKLLAHFNPTTPTPARGLGRVGGLVVSGYLKKRGAGYVRTAKPFAALPERKAGE